MNIPIIIPAYEPDNRLIMLLADLVAIDQYIIVIDDGSDSGYRDIFDRAESIIGNNGVLLRHDVNRGKGRALKTAFQYILDNLPNAVGAVTADSDGQHTCECIQEVARALERNLDSLILGVRSFDSKDIPWKSRFGNTLTLKVFKLASGFDLSDTQTGLRGIPRGFMEELLKVRGERFEFETRMLLETVGRYGIIEIPIKTVYESKDNHQTHFKPLSDSIKIYRIFFERFIRYVISAISSFAVDILLFSIFCMILKNRSGVWYAAISTALARVISAAYNYLMNYRFVFRSREKKSVSAGKYLALAITQMGCSAGLVTLAIFLFRNANEALLKMVVDTALFFISYQIQKRFVF